MSKFNKKLWIPIIVISAVLLATAIVLVSLTFTIWKVNLKMQASQVEDTQNIRVEWAVSKAVKEVEINVSHDGDKVTTIVLKNTNDILKGSYDVSAFYGKQKVSVTVKKGLFKTTKTQTVKVFADEYNIAPVTATMPVTIFSLSLLDQDEGIGNNGEKSIPTFVWFKRSEAWDYAKMPDNVYTIPVATASQITGNTNQRKIYKKTSEWIKELYEINPNSKFNLFYNDYYAYGWMQATIGNGIPAENYKVVLLSDGTASFSYFNDHFDNEKYAEEYEKMLANYTKLKKQIAKEGTYKEKSKKFVVSAEKSREYAYVMAKEESNVEWWLTRVNGTLATNTPDMYSEVNELVDQGKIKVKDLNGLLNKLTDEEKNNLKNLYNFSDTMFEKAVEEGKKVMVILGTWTDTENSTNFDQYVKAVQKYYGDDYVYYYKGHPKNPTNSVSGKLGHLKSLKLIDVDSTIPAELIFFFNPDAYCTGYQSTTFVSLDDEHSCGIFNVREESFAESYKDNIDFFITSVNSSDEKYGSLVKKDNTFVLEFTDKTNYSIAIYDEKANTMKFYKLNAQGQYEEVAKR